MNTPKGTDILRILIELYAEQEGVEIAYITEEKNDVRESNQRV